MFLYYRPQQYPWVEGLQPHNPGVSGGPRLHALSEFQGAMPRVWPTTYHWTLMGLGAMPLYALGVTTPTFNNRLAPMSVGYNTMLPGMSRRPFGG